MSGEEFVDLTAGTLEAVLPSEIFPAASLPGRRGLVEGLWKLAADLGALRRAGAPEWLVERAAVRVDELLNIAAPSAAELVAAGVDVDEAVELAITRGERFRRLVGEDASP